MNPFIKVKLEDKGALEHTAIETIRFVQSGMSSIQEWLSLDEDVQEMILTARDTQHLIEMQALASCFMNPAKALAEFSRPLDGGEMAKKLDQAEQAQADAADGMVSISQASPDDLEQAGIQLG